MASEGARGAGQVGSPPATSAELDLARYLAETRAALSRAEADLQELQAEVARLRRLEHQPSPLERDLLHDALRQRLARVAERSAACLRRCLEPKRPRLIAIETLQIFAQDILDIAGHTD